MIDMKSLLEDDNFLIGMGLLSAGAKGQSIGEAGITSIKDAAAIKKSFAGTPTKTKAVFNSITGKSQFATEAQILASNGILVPIPKKEDGRKIVEGADGFKYYADTQERVLPGVEKENKNSQRQIIEAADGYKYYVDNGERVFPDVEKEEKVPLVKIEGDKKESKFDETLGKSEAEYVVEIRNDSNKAIDQNSELEIIGALSMELKSGKFGTTFLEIAKIGERAGIDMNWLSSYEGAGTATVANAEVLQVLSSSMVLNAISKTKGSISDKEMSFFQSIAPNLGMSPEGIQKTVEITKRINERKILKADMMNDWLTDDGSGKKILPSTKKLVEYIDKNGKTKTKMMNFDQMWSNYTKNTPLFNEEEKEELTSIAASQPDGDNIKIYKGNKYYILPGGKVIFIGKVQK